MYMQIDTYFPTVFETSHPDTLTAAGVPTCHPCTASSPTTQSLGYSIYTEWGNMLRLSGRRGDGSHAVIPGRHEFPIMWWRDEDCFLQWSLLYSVIRNFERDFKIFLCVMTTRYYYILKYSSLLKSQEKLFSHLFFPVQQWCVLLKCAIRGTAGSNTYG